MNKNIIKYTSYFTLFILFIYTIAIPIAFPGITPALEAASITKDEVYKGVVLALLLILISKIGKNVSQSTEPDRTPPEETTEEVDLLARAIHAEARGEPYQGQVGVAAVILNRRNNPQFPQSIREIIYQSGQFSSVDDGQINLIPGPSAYKAAYDALDGEDPTQEALYFYNPDTAKNTEWFDENTITTVKIGNHVFAR